MKQNDEDTIYLDLPEDMTEEEFQKAMDHLAEVVIAQLEHNIAPK
jgi:hypothetical protein